MPVSKVEYGGNTLIDLTNDTVTPQTLLKGVTAHDASGKQITGTLEVNTKTYEITLTKASGWVLLTTLDDEVLEHINDESLIVSLVNISPYEYTFYSGSMFIVGNKPIGYNGTYPSYGLANRENSETSIQSNHIYYPANNTGTSDALGGLGVFRVNGGKYYIKPRDGFITAGIYRLTFVW